MRNKLKSQLLVLVAIGPFLTQILGVSRSALETLTGIDDNRIEV